MSNSFTDSEGDTFTVTKGAWFGDATITLEVTCTNDDVETAERFSFFKADATKIIALIAEAAAEKPVPQTREQIAAFAKRWDARVEAGWVDQDSRVTK